MTVQIIITKIVIGAADGKCGTDNVTPIAPRIGNTPTEYILTAHSHSRCINKSTVFCVERYRTFFRLTDNFIGQIVKFRIGGGQDRALGAESSPELAAMIPRAELKMYPEWGHALYEEAKDFNRVVLEFLSRK